MPVDQARVKCSVVTAVDVFTVVPSYISCAENSQTISINFNRGVSLRPANIPGSKFTFSL